LESNLRLYLMHSSGQTPIEISAEGTKEVMGSVTLIDVREPEEYEVCRIEGAELIPMGTVAENLQRLERLSDEKPLVVFCHHGVRSLHVAEWLRRHGIENAQSMQGGIDAWSRVVDPGVARY
jgi:rhodanese-related sulfurtransferase